MFERIIVVDWSGGGAENKANSGLAMAVWSRAAGGPTIERPVQRRPSDARNWRRSQLVDWLGERLTQETPRTLILLDFPFSFPFGTGTAWGGSDLWHKFVRFIGERYGGAERGAPARALAIELGSEKTDAFRIKHRCATEWYLEHGVAYYRATELAVSQAISEFYGGQGAQVALGALSGIYSLDRLIRLRDEGKAAFAVWPFETWDGDSGGHVIAETYPALFPIVGGWKNEHERDALRAAAAAQRAAEDGSLPQWFEVPEVPFGRYSGVELQRQIQFEGWIFGIRGG